MAKGSTSAVTATPMRSGRTPPEGLSTPASDRTSHLSTISERSVSFEDSVGDGSDAKDEEMMEYEYLEEKTPAPMQEFDDQGDAVVSAGRSGGSRSLSRNLVEDFEEISKPDPAYDDFEDGAEDSDASEHVAKGPAKSRGHRPPMNSSTSAANKVLGCVYEQMMDSSEWIQQFSPKSVRQALWVELKNELAWPVNSISTNQVAEDTVSLLRAMGCEPQTHPSEAALKDWPSAIAGRGLQKWKRKLRLSFGTTDIELGRQPIARSAAEQVDPSKIPLPQTPQKAQDGSARRNTTDGVFSAKTVGSPYFQDSHMVTPRSANRTERLVREAEASCATEAEERSLSWRASRRFTPRPDSSDDEDDDFPDYGDDHDSPSDELARQVREVSEMERLNSTPRLELATHRPIAQIKHSKGTHNKSEKSMQWFRAFVYEMKGTHTSPNEWCMAFELSLKDGALHWYRQLPRKTKRQWKLLSDAFIKYYGSLFTQSAKARYYSAKRDDAEHICDYLNRLNGYARNASLQFEKGGRDAKDHVQRFLESCGDRGLERRLCHARVKDIHELEDMITDILKLEERASSRETSAHRSRGREQSRGREDMRNEASRDSYRRDRSDRTDRRDRDFNRRRDDSRHVPRISLAEASLTDIMAELQVRDSHGARTERSHQPSRTYSGPYHSDENGRHIAAANELERRAAAEGTYAHAEHRPRRDDAPGRAHDRNDRYAGRDHRDGCPRQYNDNRPRQYSPCAACGGAGHSAHYCYRRCKLCKQVHDVGKCEALQALTSLLRTEVKKKDLTPELQSLIYDSHLI